MCVCQSVTANTVPKHDLLHLWQKVTVEVQKLRGKEVGRLRREGGKRERERLETERERELHVYGFCT